MPVPLRERDTAAHGAILSEYETGLFGGSGNRGKIDRVERIIPEAGKILGIHQNIGNILDINAGGLIGNDLLSLFKELFALRLIHCGDGSAVDFVKRGGFKVHEIIVRG